MKRVTGNHPKKREMRLPRPLCPLFSLAEYSQFEYGTAIRTVLNNRGKIDNLKRRGLSTGEFRETWKLIRETWSALAERERGAPPGGGHSTKGTDVYEETGGGNTTQGRPREGKRGKIKE